MLDSVQQLLILQDRDQRAQRLRHVLDSLPRERAAIETRLQAESAAYESHKKAAQLIEAQRKELDNDVKAKQEQIARYSNQQLETRKNEEYQTLGHEIERVKKEIAEVEDRELELMVRYDEALKEVNAEASKVKEHQAAASLRRKDLEDRAASLALELKTLEAEIAALEQQTDSAALSLYRRLLKSKGDSALAKIQEGGICTGCHMKLTQQEINDAKGGLKLIHCANCGRIIYWQSEFA